MAAAETNRSMLLLKPIPIFIATVALLIVSTSRADDSTPFSARVISIVGTARYWDTNQAKSNWSALRLGDKFSVGSVLQTNSKDSTADFEVAMPDADGRGTLRMFSNCVLKLIALNSKTSGLVRTMDIGFDVPVGQIRVSVDGVPDYALALNANSFSMRLTIPRSTAGSQETVFLFAGTGSLTVLKGTVKASIGSGPAKLIRAGEQLRSDVNEITKLPPEAPELKLGQ
jgi:hypothetical protein